VGEKRNVYRFLVGNPVGRRRLGRTRRRRVGDVKTDFVEIGLSAVNWIVLALDRYIWRALVTAVTNLRVP
jgi:hypothetical protein